ncbi:MAG: pseudouridine synthase [Verrucomicrobia bacterium]|nr:pseudouridine synthase [Verrucomicrobiota bacterium]
MSISVRLQKHLADQGIASRRQAETLIAEGRVEVNGEPAQLGQKIMPGMDRITLDGQLIRAQKVTSVVLAMHKPKGVLCSNEDPHHERTVFDLLPSIYREHRLFCAGRLDKDSEGLLILTNDGALSQQLTHPSNNVIKKYHVTVHKPFDAKDIRTMLNGITYEGERCRRKR